MVAQRPCLLYDGCVALNGRLAARRVRWWIILASWSGFKTIGGASGRYTCHVAVQSPWLVQNLGAHVLAPKLGEKSGASVPKLACVLLALLWDARLCFSSCQCCCVAPYALPLLRAAFLCLVCVR